MEFEIGLSESSRNGVLRSVAMGAAGGAVYKIETSGSSGDPRSMSRSEKTMEQQRMSSFAPANLRSETVRHPTCHALRATISLKQISSVAVARPHFLVQFESLSGSGAGYQTRDAALSHLVRLTSREQNLARLVCDGRSNQEIADERGLSLETVKRHLHSIFCKLEVPSRSRLIALVR